MCNTHVWRHESAFLLQPSRPAAPCHADACASCSQPPGVHSTSPSAIPPACLPPASPPRGLALSFSRSLTATVPFSCPSPPCRPLPLPCETAAELSTPRTQQGWRGRATTLPASTVPHEDVSPVRSRSPVPLSCKPRSSDLPSVVDTMPPPSYAVAASLSLSCLTAGVCYVGPLSSQSNLLPTTLLDSQYTPRSVLGVPRQASPKLTSCSTSEVAPPGTQPDSEASRSPGILRNAVWPEQLALTRFKASPTTMSMACASKRPRAPAAELSRPGMPSPQCFLAPSCSCSVTSPAARGAHHADPSQSLGACAREASPLTNAHQAPSPAPARPLLWQTLFDASMTRLAMQPTTGAAQGHPLFALRVWQVQKLAPVRVTVPKP